MAIWKIIDIEASIQNRMLVKNQRFVPGWKGSGPYRYLEKYFGGGYKYLHQYSKIFKLIFFEVMYAILTLSGINITMLVNFFFFSLSLLPVPLFSGVPRICQSGAKPGVWGRNPQPPTNFYSMNEV